MGEGSLQLQCNFRTVLADVGTATTASSLSPWRLSRPGGEGGGNADYTRGSQKPFGHKASLQDGFTVCVKGTSSLAPN